MGGGTPLFRLPRTTTRTLCFALCSVAAATAQHIPVHPPNPLLVVLGLCERLAKLARALVLGARVARTAVLRWKPKEKRLGSDMSSREPTETTTDRVADARSSETCHGHVIF